MHWATPCNLWQSAASLVLDFFMYKMRARRWTGVFLSCFLALLSSTFLLSLCFAHLELSWRTGNSGILSSDREVSGVFCCCALLLLKTLSFPWYYLRVRRTFPAQSKPFLMVGEEQGDLLGKVWLFELVLSAVLFALHNVRNLMPLS